MPAQDKGPLKRRPNRPTHTATVTGTTRISPDLIRLSFDCPAIVGMDLPFTDHYIKIMFGDALRTYTLRSFDTEAGTFDVDFVTHGDEGIAGPWAQKAQPGETMSFKGPGGAWAPTDAYDHIVLVGDESAAPAVCASLERIAELPTPVPSTVFLEVADEDSRFDVPQPPHSTITWVYRGDAAHGAALASAVRAADLPTENTGWFVHGVAEMIRDLRRFLFVDNDVPKTAASISGYWRTGMTEDQWQSSKRDFNQANEQEEQKLKG